MNRIYRIVWNATINRWVVASEVAKGRKKKTGRGEQVATGAAVMFAATLMLGTGVPLSAQAQVQGWSVAECYLFPSLYPRLCGGKKGGTASPAPAPAPTPAPAPEPPRLPEGSLNTFKYFKAKSTDPDASPTGKNSIAVGPRSSATQEVSMAAGYSSKATAGYATAVGGFAEATGYASSAFGTSASAAGDSSVSVGRNSKASHNRSVAVGNAAEALNDFGVALGNHAKVRGVRGTALGNATEVTADAARSVALGFHSVADRADTVSVGNSNEQRQIVNVAAGTEGADAVNVNQLKGVTGALGGGAGVDGKGNVTAPSYTINGNTYGNVGDALAAAAAAGGASPYFKANSTGAAASASGADAVAAGQNARAQADRSVALGVDSMADRADSVAVGDDTRQRQVIHMAAGTEDTDAVNVGQLKASGLIDSAGKAQRAVLFDGPDGEVDTKGRRIINVANAIDDTDALTLAQLKGAGLTFNNSGTVVSRVVTYQPASGTPGTQPVVVLEDNTLLRNVAAGKVDTDAANVGQVHDIVRQSTSVQSRGVEPLITLTRSVVRNGARVESAEPGQAMLDPLTTRSAMPTQRATVDIGDDDADDTPGSGRASLPNNGSGVKGESNANLVQFYANDYLRATGRSDSAGSAPASDAAVASVPVAVAIGADARAQVEASTALGAQAIVTAAGRDSVALGAGSVANEANVVSVGTDGTTAFQTFDKDSKRITIQNQANTRRIVNMAAGRNDNDAVNVEQLKAVTTALGGGAGVGSDGTVAAPSYEVGGAKYGNVGDALKAAADAGTAASAQAVKYANADKTSVALEGKGGTTISNVKAGTAAGDAVNVGQLQTAGLIDGKGNVQKAVLFNGPNGEANAAGTKLVNLAAGTADTDGVNLKQLKDAGVGVDDKGNITGAFVAYDDAEKGKVTLGGGKAGTTLANVKAGTADMDAVNVKQFKDAGLLDDKGNAQKAVLFNGPNGEANAAGTKLVNVAKGVAGTDAVNIDQLKGVTGALGGGAGVDDKGNVTAPSYEVGGSKYANVGDALKAAAASGAADPLAVKYADADKTSLALEGKGGTTIGNVKAASADDQAVNFKQLKDAGLSVDDKGNVTNSFVAYDDAEKGKVTLGGGKDGTTLANVKAGTADMDAVNVKQFKDAGLLDDKGNAQKAVLFNGPNGEANANGTKLVNLAAGTADTDGVNLKQLKDAGVGVDDKGNITGAFVAYDGSDKTKVTFAGGKAGTTLSNVAKGVAGTDAVNIDQLKGVTTALGGGAGVDDKGNVTAPSYEVGGTKYGNVGDALKAAADAGTAGSALAVKYADADKTSIALEGKGGTTIGNVKAASADDQAVNFKQLKDAGLSVDDKGNVTNSFVAYDSSDKAKVTLGGGKDGTTLANVKAGTADMDAVNVKQFKDAGLLDDKGNAQKAVLFNGPNGEANVDGTRIVNVAKGVAGTDAVNIDQLKGVTGALGGGAGVDDKGNVTAPSYEVGGSKYGNVGDALQAVADAGVAADAQAVKYADADKTSIALEGKGGTTIGNVKAAAADDQAVNLKQLKDAGVGVDDKGNITGAFVAYDDAEKGKVTLGGGKAGTTLANVKAGTADMDAVNVKQFKDAGLLDDKGNAQKAVLFNGPNGDANAAGTKLVGLKAGTDDTDGVNLKQLKDAGITVDPTTGAITNALVSYDAADKAKVTLGGTDGTTIANVKAATANDQAVNLKQLKDAGVGIDDKGNITGAFVAYDDAKKGAVTLGGGTDGTTIHNLKAGTANTDATNVSQLRGLTTALGGGAGVGSDGAIVAPTYTLAGNTYNTVSDALDDLDGRTVANSNAISDLNSGKGVKYFRANSSAADASATGDNATAMGPQSQATGKASTAAGASARALGESSSAFGNNAEASAINSTALGASAKAVQSKAIAIGNSANANAEQAVVIGASAGASGKNAVALGASSAANGTSAIALGNNARAAQANAVALGSDSVTDRANSVSVGSATQSRQITNVGAGTSGTDAVNVTQLKGVTTALGGGAGVDDKGNVTAPSYEIGGSKYGNVGDALQAVADAGVAADAQAVKYADADKTSISLEGKDGTTIANVKAASADDQAVNFKQLKDAGLSVDDKGNVTNSFVAYDDAEKGKVTLGGGKAGTTLANVKAGTADTDAVNVSQLKTAGLIDDKGNAQKAVLFNGPNGEANANGTKLVNLAAGTADTDGVNLKQLKDAGVGVDDKGNITGAFVAYDDAEKGKVTFAGGKSGTTLSNVAKGVAGTDAVNIDQLKGVTTALGGGAGVDDKGNVTAPSYEVGGTKYGNVGDALKAAADAGTAGSALAVKYADADKTSIALEGKDGTTISNVKAGTADTDAVNVSQLKTAGLIDDEGNTQKAVLFNGPNGEANANGTKLVNVAAGTATTDAVNIGQLAQSGLFDTKTGTMLRGITYVAGSVEAGNPRIELERGTGNSRFFVDGDRAKGFLPKGTVIANVADAVQDTDAANLGQVREIAGDSGVRLDNTLRVGFGNIVRAGSQPVVLWTEAPTSRADVTAQGGSGTKYDSDANKVEFYANNYLRATGRGDGAGSTPSSDAAYTAALGAVAIGADARSSANGTLALGAQSLVTANGTDSVALGAGSVANEANVVSLGTDGTTSFQTYDKDNNRITIQNPANTRRIINMAAGKGDNDAVNVSQLKQVTTALGGGAGVAADGSVTQPTYSVGGGSYSSVGEALQAMDARAATGSALGITYDDDTHGKVTFSGQDGTTLSNVKAGTADTDAVNVSQLKASGLVDGDGKSMLAVTYDDAGKTAITLGGKGSTTPVRVKNVADAEADDEAVNLKQLKNAGLVGGSGSTLDAVVYDEGSSKGMVSFGGAAGTVLNNVADGNIAAGSRQAVNGGQIDSLRNALEGKISGLDGRVTKAEKDLKNATGSVPYVSVKGPGADANAGADGSGSIAVGGDSKVAGERGVAVGNGAQVQADAPNAVALGSNSVADRANTVSVGAPGSERAIANVANGSADTDAVNLRQMNQGIQSAKDYTDGKVNDVWNAINRDVDQMNRQVNRGIAAASALVNVTPYLPGRTAINAGVASYRGEAALGVGLSRWSDNGRFNFNAGISAAKDDEPVYRVGVGYVF